MPNVAPNPPVGADPTAEKPQKETEAAAELSALVNYVEPVHFYTFESAESKCTTMILDYFLIFVKVKLISF